MGVGTGARLRNVCGTADSRFLGVFRHVPGLSSAELQEGVIRLCSIKSWQGISKACGRGGLGGLGLGRKLGDWLNEIIYTNQYKS